MDYIAESNSGSDGNSPVNDNPQLEVRNFLSSDMAENDEISSQSSSTPMIESDTATLKDTNEKVEPCGSEQPPSKKRKLDESSSNCPICFDSLTNSDEHRLCSLKCGHIFGKSCLLRWFSSNKRKCCPLCKRKAFNNDIRYIYAKDLMALDVSELEEIKHKIKKVTREKNRMYFELTMALCKEHLLINDMQCLKRNVDSLSRQQLS